MPSPLPNMSEEEFIEVYTGLVKEETRFLYRYQEWVVPSQKLISMIWRKRVHR